MTRLEMVEKIKDKTGVTYEEARETLESSNWDMLDAIVALERANMGAGAASGAAAGAAATEPKPEKAAPEQPFVGEAMPMPRKRVVRHSAGGEAGDKIASVVRWLGMVIKKGEENHIDVSRKDKPVLSISLTSLVLLFLLSWWIPSLLIIAGLFTGYKFHFSGNLVAGKIVNSAAEKASTKADELKNKMNDKAQ